MTITEKLFNSIKANKEELAADLGRLQQMARRMTNVIEVQALIEELDQEERELKTRYSSLRKTLLDTQIEIIDNQHISMPQSELKAKAQNKIRDWSRISV